MRHQELVDELLRKRDEWGYCEICGFGRTQENCGIIGHATNCVLYLAAQVITEQEELVATLKDAIGIVDATDA